MERCSAGIINYIEHNSNSNCKFRNFFTSWFRPRREISFRFMAGSVYTDRMAAQPSVRVTRKEPDVYEVEVAAARPTRHCITAGLGDVEGLTGGKANAERLIEESFRFLLERESNTSILGSFRITDISRYFPEYEGEIRRRLAK
jgi:hypothetical protein